MAVARVLIENVGGFAEAFEGKGSEDIELGVRLWKAGATFTLLPNSYVFHIPHHRDRSREESSDFIHALRLLSMHTTPAMEALCAFDCENANPMIDILGALTPSLRDLARHAAIRSAQSAQCDVLRLSNPDLVIGPPLSRLCSSPSNSRVVYPVPTNCADQIPLFGFALPFADKFFRVAVVNCFWQLLPERLACRLFDEALRVAEQAY